MLYATRCMADPKDPHTLADHRLGTGLGHVHDGDADHDHGDTDQHPIIDLIRQSSGSELSEPPCQGAWQEHLPGLKGS